MSADFPPSLPPPPADNHFKPTWVSVVCAAVVTVAYVLLVGVVGKHADGLIAYVKLFLGAGLVIGVSSGIVAAGARMLLKKSSAQANGVFCAALFVLASIGVLAQMRTQQVAMAAAAEAAAAEAKAANAKKQPATAPAPTTAPAPVPAAPAAKPAQLQAAAAARKQFLVAEKYLREKSAAQSLVTMLDQGKPWRWIDRTAEVRSPEFQRAYQAWRAAEIEAGNDPKVGEKEMSAITALHAIRMAVSKYRLKNDRPPALRHISALPANPLTGHKSLARSGAATASHGWSYDEQTGRVRIVLPEGTIAAGLHKDEIERVTGRK